MDGVKIIALVGMPGAGKGTCSSYIEEKYKVPLIHFGNMVYEEVKKRGLDNVKDEIFVREDMRAKEGPAVLAKRVAERAREYIKEGHKAIVLDGLYSWSEYKYLKEQFGDSLVVIAVAAPRKARYERILVRQEDHRKYTSEEQIIDREVAEIEHLEKGGPIAAADYTLVNDGTPQELWATLEQMLKEINFTK